MLGLSRRNAVRGSAMTKFGNCRRKVYRGGSIGSVIPIISPASVAALAMLISQAQGLSITPASFSHHAKHSLSSMSLYLSVYGVPTDGKRRRSEALHWLYPRSKRSELMMANPEGTQQLRDRDLEFMFYDEAQVRLYMTYNYNYRQFTSCVCALIFRASGSSTLSYRTR